MSATPLVSILVCNFGNSLFLKDAIASALNQAYSSIQVVCIDFRPTEQSRQILSAYEDRVISVSMDDRGSASILEAGIKASQGDVICFLGSEDLFLPEKVSKVVETFAANPNSHWCFHPLTQIDRNSKTLLELFHRQMSREYDLRLHAEKKGRLPIELPGLSGFCFRRSLLEEMKPLPNTDSAFIIEWTLKLAATALSQGFFLTENLASQRVYSRNKIYSRQDQSSVDAAVLLPTAYWIRKRFPNLKKFANNLFAQGMVASWQIQSSELEQQDLIQSYLKSLPMMERLEINSKAVYRYLLPS